MAKLKRLFEPITVGKLELKSRLVMLSMATGYREEDGRPSLLLKKFLTERAGAGGVGLIITSFCPFSHSYEFVAGMYSDDFIPSLRELTDAIHAHGVPIFAQMTALHQWAKDKDTALEYVGPTEIVPRPTTLTPRPLTIDEIHQIVEAYGEGARRAREAGFDGVEFLFGVGNFVSKFMSPFTNKREDEYGGSLENRMRLPVEVINRARQKVGTDYPISWRYSADELLEGGYNLDGGQEIARVLENAGVDCLNLQVGWHDSPIAAVQQWCPDGKWVYMAEAIKKAVNIPVMATYQICEPLMAERIIAEGKADLIGMGRAFIADPEFALKAKEGRIDGINYCMRCCRCMDQCVAREEPLDICSVNPRVGVDLETDIEPATKPKRVLVVGGGPAGMEAARVAALRGHKVTLCEMSSRLGGLMVFGSVLNPHVEKVINYLSRQMQKAGVEVKLEQEVTPEVVEGLKPDTVVLAVGGAPLSLEISGINGDNVMSSHDMGELLGGHPPKKLGGPAGAFFMKHLYKPSRLRSLLKYKFPFGKRVVILGGGFDGCELGDMLAEKGKEVTVIEESGRIGDDIGPTSRFLYMMRLRQFGVKMITNARVTEITRKSVKGVTVTKEGVSQPFEVACDSVALASGLQVNMELGQQLEAKGPPRFLIGDATERQPMPPPYIWGRTQPRRIGEAIKAGYRVAVEL